MATKKKTVAKKKAAPAKEHLWEVRMRGFKSEPRLRVIVDAPTEEDAREKAKAQVAAIGLVAKPVVHAAIEHADWYRIWSKEKGSTSYSIIREYCVFKDFKKGHGSRDSEGFKNTVGWVSVELGSTDTGGNHFTEPNKGLVYFDWDKKGLYISFVDDDTYQWPSKVFRFRLQRAFDDILGEMRKALKKERGLTAK